MLFGLYTTYSLPLLETGLGIPLFLGGRLHGVAHRSEVTRIPVGQLLAQGNRVVHGGAKGGAVFRAEQTEIDAAVVCDEVLHAGLTRSVVGQIINFATKAQLLIA